MTCTRVISLIAACAALTISGCSSGDNPMAPVDPGPAPPVIRTPTAFVITRIAVRGFNASAPDGGDWDWAIFEEDRKPDIMVSLKGTAVAPLYTSDMRLNANHNGTYTFTQPASDFDGHLPRQLPYGVAGSVGLVDDDPLGDTVMAIVTFRGPEMYRQDNAAALDHTFRGDNGAVIRLQGTWVY